MYTAFSGPSDQTPPLTSDTTNPIPTKPGNEQTIIGALVGVTLLAITVMILIIVFMVRYTKKHRINEYEDERARDVPVQTTTNEAYGIPTPFNMTENNTYAVADLTESGEEHEYEDIDTSPATVPLPPS